MVSLETAPCYVSGNQGKTLSTEFSLRRVTGPLEIFRSYQHFFSIQVFVELLIQILVSTSLTLINIAHSPGLTKMGLLITTL